MSEEKNVIKDTIVDFVHSWKKAYIRDEFTIIHNGELILFRFYARFADRYGHVEGNKMILITNDCMLFVEELICFDFKPCFKLWTLSPNLIDPTIIEVFNNLDILLYTKDLNCAIFPINPKITYVPYLQSGIFYNKTRIYNPIKSVYFDCGNYDIDVNVLADLLRDVKCKSATIFAKQTDIDKFLDFLITDLPKISDCKFDVEIVNLSYNTKINPNKLLQCENLQNLVVLNTIYKPQFQYNQTQQNKLNWQKIALELKTPLGPDIVNMIECYL